MHLIVELYVSFPLRPDRWVLLFTGKICCLELSDVDEINRAISFVKNYPLIVCIVNCLVSIFGHYNIWDGMTR